MAFRAVIFDFGGVLVRTYDGSDRRKWAERLGLGERELISLVFDSEHSVRATRGEIPEEEMWRQLGLQLGLQAEGLAKFRRDFWAGDRLDERLVDFLKGLRPRYKTAVLSNAWSDTRKAFVEDFALDRAVDELIISAEEGVAKPDARIFRIAVERLGVSLGEAVFVDDILANVESARSLGMYGIHFRDTDQAIADVRKCLGS